MKIVLDTHTLLWYLTDYQKLSKEAGTALESAGIIFLPTIVLLEFLYTLKKFHREDEFSKFLNQLKKSKKVRIISLDLVVVERVIKFSTELEMHDRTIVATAELLKALLITKDEKIQNSYKNTIW